MKNVAFVLLVTCSFALGVLDASAQTAKDVAVTYQINVLHTGAIYTPTLLPPLHVKWSVDLGATVSYPLIAEGKVFVIAGPSGSLVNLYALDAQNGSIVWGPVLIPEGFYWWAAAAYDNGMIFVVPNTISGLQSGAMYAFAASDGHQIWNTLLPGQYFFTAPPVAKNGVVYTGGAGVGGTVYAIRETDGTLLWTASVENGDNSSPVVTSKAVYVSYVCPQTYDFKPKTGALIWHYSGPCEGGGGATPVLYKNLLYVRDWSRSINGHNGDILDAVAGTYVGGFDADFAPAFQGKNGFYVQSSGLNAVNAATNTTVWTATPAQGDTYSSPPIVVNGVVYVGTYEGNLLGYRAGTGKRVVSLNMGYSIAAAETGSVGSPESGLGAGQGILVVPASTHLIALSH
jgi:outer membrane protein assembly factor BamB